MVKLTFEAAFKYPFNRAKAMWNIFWILLPIFGWFALWGYYIRIVKEFCKGKFKKLPTFNFNKDLKLGFSMFIKSLPFILAYAIISLILSLTFEGVWSFIDILLRIFIIPILFINFMNKETVESLFEFKILKSVFNNLGGYIIAILKDALLAIIFFIMWIVLVGIPAGAFTHNIFLANFYREKIK
jgi:hypothetical protein